MYSNEHVFCIAVDNNDLSRPRGEVWLPQTEVVSKECFYSECWRHELVSRRSVKWTHFLCETRAQHVAARWLTRKPGSIQSTGKQPMHWLVTFLQISSLIKMKTSSRRKAITFNMITWKLLTKNCEVHQMEIQGVFVSYYAYFSVKLEKSDVVLPWQQITIAVTQVCASRKLTFRLWSKLTMSSYQHLCFEHSNILFFPNFVKNKIRCQLRQTQTLHACRLTSQTLRCTLQFFVIFTMHS